MIIFFVIKDHTNATSSNHPMTTISSIAQRKTSKCNQNTNAASSSISKPTNVGNNTQTPVAIKRVYKPRGKTRARNVNPSEVHTIDFQNDGTKPSSRNSKVCWVVKR